MLGCSGLPASNTYQWTSSVVLSRPLDTVYSKVADQFPFRWLNLTLAVTWHWLLIWSRKVKPRILHLFSLIVFPFALHLTSPYCVHFYPISPFPLISNHTLFRNLPLPFQLNKKRYLKAFYLGLSRCNWSLTDESCLDSWLYSGV